MEREVYPFQTRLRQGAIQRYPPNGNGTRPQENTLTIALPVENLTAVGLKPKATKKDKAMIKRILFLAAVVGAVNSAQAQWTVEVPESEFTAVVGGTNTNLNALANAGGGVFFAGNLNSPTRTIVKIDTNLLPGSRVTQVATDAQLVAAIAAVNGTAADPPATAVRFQAMGVDSNGQLIVYLDGSGMTAALLSITPNSPHTITVLASDVDATPTSVEGGNGMAVVGTTAYLLVDGAFGFASGDSVISVNTALPIAIQGSRTSTIVIGEAALLAASGQSLAADQSFNDIEFIDSTRAVLINSGVTNSNDDLVLLDISGAPAVSKYVVATDIEADVASADVGYSGVTVTGTGRVVLANMFGTAASAADDGVIYLSAITPPNATATVDSEATIVAQAGGTDAFIGADGLVFDSTSSRIYAVSDGTGNSGLVYTQATATVSDWLLCD